MSAELVTIPAQVNPRAEITSGSDRARACAEIVKATAINIGGRKFIPIEGWQCLAAASGLMLSAGEVEAIEGGIRARGRVIRLSDGAIVAESEGFLGNDEPTWAMRPLYARRAMCQTRAQSRAARGALAWIVTLIDKNLSTTPAEEVPAEGFPEHRSAAPARTSRRTAAAPPPEQDGPPLDEREEPQATRQPLFGRASK